jgi:hypothetical protein
MARWLTTIRLCRTFRQIVAVTIVGASGQVGRPVTYEAILWGRHCHDWLSSPPWFGSDYRRSYCKRAEKTDEMHYCDFDFDSDWR